MRIMRPTGKYDYAFYWIWAAVIVAFYFDGDVVKFVRWILLTLAVAFPLWCLCILICKATNWLGRYLKDGDQIKKLS